MEEKISKPSEMKSISDEQLLEELRLRISTNKQALEELQKLNDELKSVNEKLEESEALKSHFISNITNEIINPFTSIIGLSKSILSVSKENWKKVISMVALIHSEAFNLDFQLRNIFVAAKIEAGEIHPEIMSVDIVQLLKSVIDSYKVESKKKQLSINFKNELPLGEYDIYYFNTDAEKLKLIMANLLSNAVNFSHNQGQINIVATELEGSLTISVQDFGTGISEDNQKIIFDRFKRLDSGINSINRGHGLGLSINKALLDLLDGTIEIDSVLGKGAKFTVVIPEAVSGIEGYASDANELFFGNDEMF